MDNVVKTEYIQARLIVRPITVNVTGRDQSAFLATTNVGLRAVAETEREAYNAIMRLAEKIYDDTGVPATRERLKSR